MHPRPADSTRLNRRPEIPCSCEVLALGSRKWWHRRCLRGKARPCAQEKAIHWHLFPSGGLAWEGGILLMGRVRSVGGCFGQGRQSACPSVCLSHVASLSPMKRPRQPGPSSTVGLVHHLAQCRTCPANGENLEPWESRRRAFIGILGRRRG